MRFAWLLVGLLLLARPAHAQWKTHDVALATTAVTFSMLDWSTTMDAIRRCEPYGHERHCYHGARECVEGNPLIGCFPSPMKFRLMALAGIGTGIAVGSMLHGWKRTAWFAGWTAVSFLCVRRNVGNNFHITVKL